MDSTKIQHYRLHWLDGATTDVRGSDIVDAMNKAGIGQGALPALDYWVPLIKEGGLTLIDEPHSVKEDKASKR